MPVGSGFSGALDPGMDGRASIVFYTKDECRFVQEALAGLDVEAQIAKSCAIDLYERMGRWFERGSRSGKDRPASQSKSWPISRGGCPIGEPSRVVRVPAMGP